jgi:hypothetical protein
MIGRRFGEPLADYQARSGRPDPQAELLAAVAACPHRGSELPASQQPQGCCSGGGLTECRLGRGKRPGAVTLAECLTCQAEIA